MFEKILAIQGFEKRVEAVYEAGLIKAPIHLSYGNETQLIRLFEDIREDKDWVFSTWRSHYHALLHGVDEELLYNKIMAGESITIEVPDKKFFSSAIVGGILPVALGVAMANKLEGKDEKCFVFIGDMAAETGMFAECLKYAHGHELPIYFVVEDNGKSVGTPTRKAWGLEEIPEKLTDPGMLSQWEGGGAIYYYYDFEKYPHSGTGTFVQF